MPKIDLNKIKLGYTPLTDSIYLYRHGKDPRLALDKREAEADVISVLIEHMMNGAPKGAEKTVSFGDKKYKIRVEPIISEDQSLKDKIKMEMDRLNTLANEIFEHDYYADISAFHFLMDDLEEILNGME
ncbi:MAG: hypothetical protein ACOCP4_02010 [Candidatus Woesearchaeota archaeon]